MISKALSIALILCASFIAGCNGNDCLLSDAEAANVKKIVISVDDSGREFSFSSPSDVKNLTIPLQELVPAQDESAGIRRNETLTIDIGTEQLTFPISQMYPHGLDFYPQHGSIVEPKRFVTIEVDGHVFWIKSERFVQLIEGQMKNEAVHVDER